MGTQEEGEQRKGGISYATLGVDTSWGLICSEMVISDPIEGVTHMPSDWKLQSGCRCPDGGGLTQFFSSQRFAC